MNYVSMLSKLNHLKWACRGVIGAATGVSVWANALQSRPSWPSYIISVLPPLLVLGAFELVSRIPFREKGNWLIKFSRPLATASIAGIGAWLSYFHQKGAFAQYTDDRMTAMLLPLAIDGLMIVASVSLIELNAKVVDLEVRQQGLDVRVTRVPRGPVKATATVTSKKERIALILASAPELTIKQVAEKADVSYNYAHAIVTQLRQQAIEA